MKAILIIFIFVFLVTIDCRSQLVQSNYTGVIIPQNIGSGGSTRLPYIFRATVSGLESNSTYRYYSNACRYTDFGSTNSGAGNPVFVNSSGYIYSTSTGLSTPGGYDSLTTDASGSYTGWFGFVNTGNARFTAGNYVNPTITLDSVGNGSTKYRFALNDSILVLGYSDSATVTSGTGIYGVTLATPKNISALYDNVAGTERPLSVVYIESVGIDTVAMPSLVTFYKDSVSGRDGRFGTIVPNVLPNGVRRVNVLRFDNAQVASFQVDDDGIWSSGTNTINPNGGSVNPIRLDQIDIPLIIKSDNFIPGDFSLEQNYPNPFNPSTTIKFSIPENGNVNLKVFNMLGNEVSVLADGMYNQGNYKAVFNGSELSSGLYFYELNFTGFNGSYFKDSKKFLLIK
ncbi:MAG: T9SS type A sorting domain-containing protein [Ignavibacteria bacterium]|nr:T9SS type A sorting domain-containing protein [Ignavibacteria bacterium]